MALIQFYNRLSPFKRVILALILGILVGIFIGEPAGQLQILGTAYIRLLQMTVLPYVLVSIIGGLGRLDGNTAVSIGIKAVKVILLLWFSVMLTLLLLPLAYPKWETSGFFSTSLLAEAAQLNFVDLYIPANIFSSLSQTIVPAVVLFSLLMGISLISVKNKETLLTLTDNVADGLMGVASFVAKLAPLGIFAISASAAGTLQPEELGRLQVFLWVYLIAASLLGFVLLPLIIHWATPFSYREVLSVAGEAVITAFATGTVLVVLPMIAERCKEMLAKKHMETEETESTVDVLVPTAYSFPSTGTLLGLGFLLFSAWYVGSPLSIEQYPSFVLMGVLTAFGSMAVAIPFLLDFFHLPADQFQLYLLGSVVTARFATALAALHGFVVTLLVASAVMKRLKWQRMFQAVGVHLGITAVVMLLAGLILIQLIPYEYKGARTFQSMQIQENAVTSTYVKQFIPLSADDLARPRLDVIRERGILRVGYVENSLPYAFINNKNELVGLDMGILNALANDLGLTIEYTRIENRASEPLLLAEGSVDIIIGGNAITPHRALDVAFSDSYTHHTAGFIVMDSRRNEFSSLDRINSMKQLTLGIPPSIYYKKSIEKLFPQAKLIPVSDPAKYFMGEYNDLAALVFSSEAGSGWCMLFPKYTTMVPSGLKLIAPVGFKLPKGQADYLQFINTWLELKKENGYLQIAYDYWILGQTPRKMEPRWSVIYNVLGWQL